MTGSMKPLIGVTMEDPAGVGPEIACKMFAVKEIYNYCRPLIIGDSGCLCEGMKVGKVKRRCALLHYCGGAGGI